MRTTSTIWESASRPLFVRSVWLEAANEGRTLRRHFILDYEPKERERLRTTATTGATSPTRKRVGSFRQSNSYDECEPSRYQSSESFECGQNSCMLLGATKLRLQQQQLQQHQQQQSSTRNCLKATRSSRRRSWLHGNRKSATCYTNYIHAGHDLLSRRSSLQDLQSIYTINGPNPEERLAERVLNWLDLAGKTDIVKTQSRESSTMDKDANGTTTATTRSQRLSCRTRVDSRADEAPTRRAFKRVPTAHPRGTQRPSALAQQRATTGSKQRQLQAQPCQHNRPDSVKPITIIFNKEGVPVRLNRPARNIDLCALSSSPSTTRRLAGQLASARLYAGNGNAASPANNSARSANGDDKLYKLTPPNSNRSQHDAKKQLHIFMPSLPKKSLLLSTANGSVNSYPSTECDGNSALSQVFSELCQI